MNQHELEQLTDVQRAYHPQAHQGGRMSKNDGGRIDPKTFARFLLKDEPDNYADLLSRVREVRRIFESNKDKYQADINSGVAGLAYMDVVDTIDYLIPEAKGDKDAD